MGSNSAYTKPGTWKPSTVLTVTFLIQAHVLHWISEPKMFERKPFMWSSLPSINLFQNTLRIYQNWPSLFCITMEWQCWWLKGAFTMDLLQTQNKQHRNIWVTFSFTTDGLYCCLLCVFLNALIHICICTYIQNEGLGF